MKINIKLAVVTMGLIYAGSAMTSAFADEHEQKLNQKDVPKTIITAFTKSYPNAKMTGFSKEVEKGKTYYEVESKEGNTKRDVLYSPAGLLIEIEEGIAVGSLPQNILSEIKKSYPKAGIVKAEKETKGTIVNYEVKIKENNKVKEIVFENGKVKKVKDKENEKNEKYEKGEDNEKNEK